MTPTSILSALDADERAHTIERLDLLADKSGGPDACWPWTHTPDSANYGVLHVRLPDRRRKLVKAHRLAFEVANGWAPVTVDHMCHDFKTCPGGNTCPHRRCVNPAHLEDRTRQENASRAVKGRRFEVCRSGHDMTEENTYLPPSGGRQCRACNAAAARKSRERAAYFREKAPLLRAKRPSGADATQLVLWALSDNEGDGRCWSWRGGTPDRQGYIGIKVSGRQTYAHRLVHEVLIGPIPDGKVIDHTCHVPSECDGGLLCPHRQCVNPRHLKPITRGENSSRSRASRPRITHCRKANHEFTPENTWTDKDGRRHCRQCERDRQNAARSESKTGPDQRFREDGKCVNGHDTSVTGLTRAGRCAECQRERNREYEARKKVTV